MATDNFNRANGALGANWTGMSLGGSSTGLTIVSNQVKGTDSGSGANGNFWNADAFGSNQYSEVTVATSSLTPTTGWIAPSVRCLANGTCYVALYYNNGTNYVLQIFSKVGAGAFTLLNGFTLTLGAPLAIGTKLRLTAIGNTVSFTVDGVQKIAFFDTTVPSGGSPGVQIAGGADFLDDWTGGSAGNFQANLVSTDGNGVESWSQLSQNNSGSAGSQLLHSMRIKRPTSPATGKVRNFLYVLPVSLEGDFTYGDAMTYVRGINAHNDYNVILIEPSFQIDPWYGNHATDPDRQYESFLIDLKAWVTANLSTTGSEQHWALGFSKSGFGPQSIWYRNPTLFDVGAFWDFPAQGFTVMNQFGNDGLNYGTDANFQANYRMTDAFLDARKAPFQAQKRLWISGYNAFQADVANYDTKLTSLGIQHTYYTPANVAHAWNSGWVPNALTGLNDMALPLQLSADRPNTEWGASSKSANGMVALSWFPTGATNYIIERKSTP